MFPILRRHWALWSAWILTASTLLFLNPWVDFSWAELAACIGPLLIAVDRRIRRERLLVLGLVAVSLLAVVDPTEPTVLRLLGDTAAFVGGVLLGARAVDDQLELESIAGHLALGSDPEIALREFTRATEREIGRARRHDRSFVILSIAPAAPIPPPSAGLQRGQSPASDSPMMTRIARARWLLELRELLAEVVHLYAEVVATEQRVLCLVPEVDRADIDALVSRLESACRDRLGISVATGRAVFPNDALGVEDMIEVADRARSAAKLASVPSVLSAVEGVIEDGGDEGGRADSPAPVEGTRTGASTRDAKS